MLQHIKASIIYSITITLVCAIYLLDDLAVKHGLVQLIAYPLLPLWFTVLWRRLCFNSLPFTGLAKLELAQTDLIVGVQLECINMLVIQLALDGDGAWFSRVRRV